MADNTVLSAGSGGDTIRDLDRAGVKTQVIALDVGGTAGESIVSGVVPIAQTEHSLKKSAIITDESNQVFVTDATVIQELQEIKVILSDLLLLLTLTIGE